MLPPLCCINFKQSVEVAQGAPGHPPSLRTIRDKWVRDGPQGQGEGARLCKVQ